MAPSHSRIRNPKILEQDFFSNLSPEIIIYILSRLPIRTIMSCKCVCKSWRDLVETDELVISHFTESGPGLALFQGETSSEKPYKILEFVDDQESGDEYDCTVVLIDFSFPHRELLHSSANGLLFLFNIAEKPYKLFICNPFTREYIKLPPPIEVSSSNRRIPPNSFGFGVSRITGWFKVVRIFHGYVFNRFDDQFLKCEVYTLGTRSWRSVAIGFPLRYEPMSLGVFLNGNYHWLVKVSEFGRKILCFDFETKLFSTFSIPHVGSAYHSLSLCASWECLCLCDSYWEDIDIWIMDEYGDEKSWRQEFVINIQRPNELRGVVVPIRIYEDGDILFANELSPKLYCYSSETNTIREIDVTKSFGKVGIRPSIYTPSFLSLKTFAMEDVSSF